MSSKRSHVEAPLVIAPIMQGGGGDEDAEL